MKKIISFALMLLTGVVMITSCSTDQDSNPIVSQPTIFILNTPVQSEQYISLENNSISLSWSQPDYGFNALVSYQVQVGVVNSQGEIQWDSKDVTDEDGNVTKEDEFLKGTYNECKAEIKGKEIAMAINDIEGLDKIENYVEKGFREIALRVRASIRDVLNEETANSAIFSNSVSFKNMKSYPIIKAPASIYIIGSCNGWLEPKSDNEEALAKWTLYETEIGSNIFTGTFTVPAGNLAFRFYTKLEGWGGTNSYGADIPDMNNVACSFNNGVFDFPTESEPDKKVVNGESNWEFANFAGGSLTFTLDMNEFTLRIVIN